jgi:hypothetical protein
MMDATALANAVAQRDALSRAGQANTPQFQALQSSIMTALDAKANAASVGQFTATVGKLAIGGGILGGVMGAIFGVALKGALVGAIGVPLAILGAARLAMRSMT